MAARNKGSLSQQVAKQLLSDFQEGVRYRPGDKLPNENDLAGEYGVSRGTLREAIRILSSHGVLVVRRGMGTFVAEQLPEKADFGLMELLTQKTVLKELFELRLMVEPRCVALACRRATERELEDILTQGAAVADCIRRGADRTQADRAFHAAIVRAAHNEFMMRLLPMIDRAVETAISAGEHKEALAQITLQDHALLLEFIQKRDGEGAEHAMAIHMRHAVEELGVEDA